MARNADWIIKKAYLLASRKATPPAEGTTKYNALLEIVDTMQQVWAEEPDTEWNSLYDLVDIGTITATDSFELDDTIQYISKREGDYALATNGTNTQTYRIVSNNQLYQYRDDYVVAQRGRSVVFPKAFTSTSTVFGYTLKIPAIIYPDDIADGSDEVQCDSPLWLAYMSAYEFVRGDLIKQTTKTDLLDMANSLMDKMKEANGGQYEVVGTPWTPAGGELL